MRVKEMFLTFMVLVVAYENEACGGRYSLRKHCGPAYNFKKTTTMRTTTTIAAQSKCFDTTPSPFNPFQSELLNAKNVTFMKNGVEGVCFYYPRHNFAPHYVWNYTQGVSISKCCETCSETSKCRAWVYREAGGYCWLFRSVNMEKYTHTHDSDIAGINLRDNTLPEDFRVVDPHPGTDIVRSRDGTAECTVEKGFLEYDVLETYNEPLTFIQCCCLCAEEPKCIAWSLLNETCILSSNATISYADNRQRGIVGKVKRIK